MPTTSWLSVVTLALLCHLEEQFSCRNSGSPKCTIRALLGLKTLKLCALHGRATRGEYFKFREEILKTVFALRANVCSCLKTSIPVGRTSLQIRGEIKRATVCGPGARKRAHNPV